MNNKISNLRFDNLTQCVEQQKYGELKAYQGVYKTAYNSGQYKGSL